MSLRFSSPRCQRAREKSWIVFVGRIGSVERQRAIMPQSLIENPLVIGRLINHNRRLLSMILIGSHPYCGACREHGRARTPRAMACLAEQGEEHWVLSLVIGPILLAAPGSLSLGRKVESWTAASTISEIISAARISIVSETSVYSVERSSFTTSNLAVRGDTRARRLR